MSGLITFEMDFKDFSRANFCLAKKLFITIIIFSVLFDNNTESYNIIYFTILYRYIIFKRAIFFTKKRQKIKKLNLINEAN